MKSDFRQISVLSQVAKVLEKVEGPQDKSTITALTSITQDWYNATDTNSCNDGVNVVFVDFRQG